MRLDKVKFVGIGPFSKAVELVIDPEVTVLTGANDTGKTSLLRALNLLGQATPGATEIMVNVDHSRRAGVVWESDTSLEMTVEYKKTGTTSKHVQLHNLNAADRIVVTYKLAPKATGINKAAIGPILDARRSPVGSAPSDRISAPIVCIPIQLNESIRDEIPVSKPSAAEKALLNVAFEGGFVPEKLLQSGVPQRRRMLAAAGAVINKLLAETLPASVGLSIVFDFDNSEGNLLLCVEDVHSGYVELSKRGEGIRALVCMMAKLDSLRDRSMHKLLLLDEPESSLHPAAQHTLRTLLEDLGSRDDVQVVYATHSPAMINPLRPRTVRVLRRAEHDGTATSEILNDASEGNLVAARHELGVLPSHSLIYAPIMIVVEGRTETNTLHRLLTKLEASEIAGFEGMSSVFRHVGLLDGEGAKYDYLCKLALAQNCHVAVFLDGDRRHDRELTKLREDYPQVPIVLLEPDKEYEDLVPLDTYLSALAGDIGAEGGALNAATLETWLDGHPDIRRRPTSKRVDAWLRDAWPQTRYRKIDVMARAVELVDAAAVDVVALRSLVTHVKASLASRPPGV